MPGMRRREFVSTARRRGRGVAARGGAQQPAMPIVGFLSSRSPGELGDAIAAFRRGLGEGGFVEGRNALIAFRWAEGDYERLPALAADLISSRASVLVAAGNSLASRNHGGDFYHSCRLHRNRRSGSTWLCC